MKKLTVPENIYLEKFDVSVKPYLSYAEIQAISKAVNNFDSLAEREVNLDMLLLHFATDIKDNVLQDTGHEALLYSGLIDEVKNSIVNIDRVYEAIKYMKSVERSLAQILKYFNSIYLSEKEDDISGSKE